MLSMTVRLCYRTRVFNLSGSKLVRYHSCDEDVVFSGLLHVGDIIREVNNQEVHTPEQLMDIVRLSPNTVTFKIIPNYDVQQYQTKVSSSGIS